MDDQPADPRSGDCCLYVYDGSAWQPVDDLTRKLADELFRLQRVRALVREHPADAVPVIPLAELAAILGDER